MRLRNACIALLACACLAMSTTASASASAAEVIGTLVLGEGSVSAVALRPPCTRPGSVAAAQVPSRRPV